jgi:hypothetical protein
VPRLSSPPRLCWHRAALLGEQTHRTAERSDTQGQATGGNRNRKKQTHHFRQGDAGVRRPSRALWPYPWAALLAAQLAIASSSDSSDAKGQPGHNSSGACAECIRCVADIGAGCLCFVSACKGRLAQTFAMQRNARMVKPGSKDIAGIELCSKHFAQPPPK